MWWSLDLLYRQVKRGMKRLVILPEGFCFSPWHVVSSFSHLIVVLTCDFSSRPRDPHHKHHVENKHPNQLTHQTPTLAHILLAPSQLPLPHQSQDKAVALARVTSKPFLHLTKFSSGLAGQLLHQATSTKQEIKNFPYWQVTVYCVSVRIAMTWITPLQLCAWMFTNPQDHKHQKGHTILCFAPDLLLWVDPNGLYLQDL